MRSTNVSDGAVAQAVHALEHAAVDVLQRHVDILGDTFFSRVKIQQLVGHLLRIQIKGPDPAHIVHRDQFAQKGVRP